MRKNNSLLRVIAVCLCICMYVSVLAACGVIFEKDNPPEIDFSASGENSVTSSTDDKNNEEEQPAYSEKGIFFSASAEDSGDGTIEHPYNSLEKIKELEIVPGSYIYIECGSKFLGSLYLSGIEGTKDDPVIITDYGKGSKPVIDGNDLEGSGVLHIVNCSNLIVENLEITDSATDEGDRRGVLVTCNNNNGGTDVVTYSNITLKNLYIHDIRGFRDAENSGMAMSSKITGGIHVWSVDGLGRLDGFTVTGCEITEVSNVGIATWQRVSYNEKGELSVKIISPYTDSFKAYAHLNVHIDGNEISHIGKNAIFVRNLFGGVIERNIVHDTAKYCVSGNSIVTRSVDGTVIQYNEGYHNLAKERESDGKIQDGCMLDADLDSKYTIWQYNYSHDNSFGLFLNCTTEGKDVAIVRYNLSVNDKGNKGIIYINYAAAGIYVYNNTIVTSYNTEYIIQSNGTGRVSYIYNNLIYNRSATAKFGISGNAAMTAANNLIYNEYGSSIEGLASFRSMNEGGIYDEDPLFVGYLQEDSILGVNNQHTYMLDAKSPALGVGTELDSVPDFFGNEYKKSIGFYCGE